MLLRIVVEIVFWAALIIFISNSISNDSFWVHAILCFACIVLAIVGAIKRNEDKMRTGSENRRYFMTFGHATVWAFFIGLVIMHI